MSASLDLRRSGLAMAGMAIVTALAAPALKAEGVPLASVKVDLPFGDREFEGAGAVPVNGACLACHSAEMVLNQPKLSPATWTAEVNKMRAVYKAPIEDADIPAIVDYLVNLQGSR
jgi:hypothetical protein